MARTRVTSVDALQGLVKIVMALDHTREYFTAARFQPEDLTKTTATYFFTLDHASARRLPCSPRASVRSYGCGAGAASANCRASCGRAGCGW
jgi:hypothetical protein